jgi:integrase
VLHGAAEPFLAPQELLLGEAAHVGVGAAEVVRLVEELGKAGQCLGDLLKRVAAEFCGGERLACLLDGGIGAITQPDVQTWVAQLTARGFAPATVVNAYQLLGRTLTAAVNADMIPRSPCRAVRLPRIEREEMRFLNPAEVAGLAGAIGPRYRALVLLGAYGGLRMGELAGLRRSRVDLVRGTVDIAEIVVEVHGQLYTGPPKTRAGRRTVGLPRAVVEELAAHMGPVGPADAYVFTAEKGGVLRTSNFRIKVWLPAARGWAGAAAPARPSPHRGRAVDRGRRQPQGGQRPSRAHLRQLHAGPLRPPVPGPR